MVHDSFESRACNIAWNRSATTKLHAGIVRCGPHASAHILFRQVEVDGTFEHELPLVVLHVFVGHRNCFTVCNLFNTAVELVGLLVLDSVQGVSCHALHNDVHLIELRRDDVVLPDVPDVQVWSGGVGNIHTLFFISIWVSDNDTPA